MNTISTRMFSWKTAIVLVFGVSLLVAGLSIVVQTKSAAAQSILLTYTRPAAPPRAIGIGSSHETPGNPVRLIIPAIGVDASIQSVGLSWRGTGEMGIPTNLTDVAWYNEGPVPGAPGSAVIDGHVDGKNVPRAVFYNLQKLEPGDMVEVVDAHGNTFRFRVVRISSYDYEASTEEVFSGDSSKVLLNLITCGGIWIKDKKSYDTRIVVFTELVSRSTEGKNSN